MKTIKMSEIEILSVQCISVIQKEIALLERLGAAQDVVSQAVYARDWADLDALFKRLEEYGKEFEMLEQERSKLFSELGKKLGFTDEKPGFYNITSRLSPELRRQMTDLYRRLKLDVLKIRLANENLNHYIASNRMVISDFLQAAFPDRKGKLYSRHGREVHSEMRSIVLDRSL
ncbi:MAG: flagellar export chaperone FlgN [Treponema sp.]|nr:flagellar export chaperone FlgN [Treponema sp.]